jgi:hypothetical protein
VKWAFLGVFAALPLQWYYVATTPLGVGRLHQLAILLFAALYFVTYKPRTVLPLRRELGVFLLANIVMLTAWTAIELYHGNLPTGPVQEFLYLGVYLAIGGYVLRAACYDRTGAIELLRWTALTASVSVLIALSFSMAKNGANPVQVFSQTVSAGDPEIFQKELFRTAFNGYGLDEATVRGNIRHEVFGAVLVAMYVASWAVHLRPLVSTTQRIVYRFSIVLSAILLVMSLSRSVIIATLLWPLIVLYRSVRTLTLTGRQIVAAYAAIGGVLVLAASGFGLVLYNRFTEDTTSYTARESLYSTAFSEIPSHFLTGGVDTLGSSSHNFVLDSLLRGGIFVAIPAAAVFLSILLTFIVLMVRLPQLPEWMVPVAAAFALPLVRLATSGGGLINPVEWVALGFITGALAAYRVLDARRAQADSDNPETSRAGEPTLA